MEYKPQNGPRKSSFKEIKLHDGTIIGIFEGKFSYYEIKLVRISLKYTNTIKNNQSYNVLTRNLVCSVTQPKKQSYT